MDEANRPKILRAADHRRMPWRNRGGMTAEVAVSPEASGADFDWRISFAEVDSSGPFSSYDGVDRVIVLVDGPPMRLTVDGAEHVLDRFVPFAFAGSSETAGTIAGPTRDFNVMTRHGRVAAEVEVVEVGGSRVVQPGEGTLVVAALAGTLRFGAATLAREDVVIGARPGLLEGEGIAALVRLVAGGGT